MDSPEWVFVLLSCVEKGWTLIIIISIIYHPLCRFEPTLLRFNQRPKSMFCFRRLTLKWSTRTRRHERHGDRRKQLLTVTSALRCRPLDQRQTIKPLWNVQHFTAFFPIPSTRRVPLKHCTLVFFIFVYMLSTQKVFTSTYCLHSIKKKFK